MHRLFEIDRRLSGLLQQTCVFDGVVDRCGRKIDSRAFVSQFGQATAIQTRTTRPVCLNSKLRRNTVAKESISKGKGVNSGFTRVELVVVIASIGLLVSILMPALASVKTQAQDEVKCKANLRQVGITIFMFLQEEDFRMPNFWVINHHSEGGPGRNHSKCNKHLWTADGRESSPRLGPDDDESYWGTAFNKYVKDINIFRCPAMAQFAEMLANALLPGFPGGEDVIQQASFGLNGFIDQLNTNSVGTQAEVVICTDHVEPRNEQADEANHGDMFCMGVDTVNLSHYRPSGSTRGEWFRGIFRHNIRKDEAFETGGRASVLWLDGRVSTIEETTGENIPNRYYDPRGIQNAPYGWLDISR